MPSVDQHTICPICQENFYEQIFRGTLGDEKIISSDPCGHIFHLSCIQQAFNHDSRCPTCRQDMYGGGVDITSEVESDQYNAATGYFLNK